MKLHNVFQALKVHWDAEPSLTTLVPGGLWWERPDQDAAYPQGVVMIEEGEPEFTSGASQINNYSVELTIRSNAGVTDAGGIQNRLDALFDRDQRDNLQVFGARKVLDLTPKKSTMKRDQQTKDARNVVVASTSFELLVQF